MNDLQDLSRSDKEELLLVLEENNRRERENKIFSYYPETGKLSRDAYKKHMMFFKAGKHYKERALIAANRSGKSLAASFEMALHLTGLYDKFPWWEGKRFDEPIQAWSVGTTHETTRDILQRYLLGPRHDLGTGMIPKDCIIRVTSQPGTQDAIHDVYVKHASGGTSQLSFKAYIQEVEAFMGTSMHVIHLDEEPHRTQIYSECLTRTMTTNGIIMCTFTPVQGLSDVVLSFLPGGQFPPDGHGEVRVYE